MVNAGSVEGAGAANNAMDFVTLLQKQLSQIATILTGDASDECFFHAGIKSKSPSKEQESDFSAAAYSKQ
jgi:hypothetical protein